jgi:hypothetical protein
MSEKAEDVAEDLPSVRQKSRGTTKPKDQSASAPKEDDYVLFVSVEKEPVSFDLGPLPPMRWNGERLAWRVPAADAHKFDRHHWCEIGRVKRYEAD